jgi:pimeloyl-ACP methyl ester carboxylesterase
VADELRALARLTFDEVAEATGGIGALHSAIADRAFRGPSPSRVVHDAVAGGVYTGLRGALALAVLNGLRGDALEADGSDLAETMAFRVRGRAVAPAELDVGPRVVVFLHGLFETEYAWGRDSYGARLADELGVTPLWVRYNTGRRISENGRSLAALLDALVAVAAVEEITLVGHSMGGLVARSACSIGGSWTSLVRHTVSLGTPHMGAPLASAVAYASAALDVVPETRPLARLLRRRSGGIRDLRSGSLVDEDWRGRDPDALRAAACREVPLLEGATHHFVAATVTRSASHPVGRLIGDWLVLAPSASGRSRTRVIGFRDEDGLMLGGAHHLALLNHPEVYARLRDWLAPGGGRRARARLPRARAS